MISIDSEKERKRIKIIIISVVNSIALESCTMQWWSAGGRLKLNWQRKFKRKSAVDYNGQLWRVDGESKVAMHN